MSENEAFIYGSIFDLVRKGFSPLAEIKEIVWEEITDNGWEQEISAAWAYSLIEAEITKVAAERKTWNRPTDTEKLIAAFEELCKLNIIALHNAGYTTSDGEYEVVEVERQLRVLGKRSDGYCFYHEQDLARAIVPENPNLMLAFQKVDNSNDEITVAIGRKIVEVLQSYGFTIEWNGTATQKIKLVGFRWQQLYDISANNLLNYQKVVEIMAK